MRVNESIKELRRICQQSREDEFYHMPWAERNFGRKLSIYLTKLLLEMGVSANQASAIGLIIGVIGGVFLAFPNPKYWFIGIVLLLLFDLFTYIDGEIARYNKSASPEGAFWNSMPEQFIWLYLPICLSFGIYGTLHNIFPFIFGFLGVMSLSLTASAQLLPYSILHAKGLLSEALTIDKTAKLDEHTKIIIKYEQLLFGHFLNLLFWLLIGSIIDCFTSPFTIGYLSFNARFIFFIIYTLIWLAGAVRSIYLPLHSGVRLRH